jgi:hypothetical protein
LTDADLPAAFGRRYGVAVAKDDQQLIHRFAWSAKGRRFVELDEENDLWLPGQRNPQPIEQLSDWTLNRIHDRAVALLRQHPDQDPFEHLVSEVYTAGNGRTPRLIMSIVGKELNRARRDLGLGRSR